MKIIKPSVKIFDLPEPTDHDGVLMHLERIGRTCYKSEDKITTDSAAKFLQNIRNRKHWAMLEHYIFALSVPFWMYDDFRGMVKRACAAHDSELLTKLSFIHFTEWEDFSDAKYQYVVSFNATALNYLVATDTVMKNSGCAINHLFQFMKNNYPELMMDPGISSVSIDWNIKFLSREEVKAMPMWLRDVHDFMSVLFVVDRGVTHEIVRHRPVSYAQESTRYCNYSQGKFGNEITVILPSFYDTGMGTMSNSLVFDEWKAACEASERRYNKLIEMGSTPQQARSVLPNSLKADLNMTAYLKEFKHFFNMRCEKGAHPQMREVACPLLIEANNENEYYKGVFEENMHLLDKAE